MSRFLFVGNDMYGVVNLSIGLAQQLRKNDHDVVYCVGDGFKDYIEKHGLIHKTLVYPELRYPLHTYTVCLSSLEATELLLDQSLASIKEYAPDCIVTTFDGLPGIYLAEFLHIPLVVINPFDLNKKFWQKFWLENGVDKFRDKIGKETERKIFNDYGVILDSFKRKYALELPKNLHGCLFGGTIETTHTRRIDLIVNSKYFLNQLAVNTDKRFYVGSMIRETAMDEKGYQIEFSKNKPLIYISLGTVYGRNQIFFDACVKALGELDAQVIYSLGRAKLDTSRVPKNFTVRDFVPQLEVLKKASVFISHGGMNSVHELIKYKVPSILCPQGYDEFIISDLMKEHKAGLVLLQNEMSPENIKKNVTRLLNKDPEIIDGLNKVFKSFEDAGGVHQAELVIKNFING